MRFATSEQAQKALAVLQRSVSSTATVFETAAVYADVCVRVFAFATPECDLLSSEDLYVRHAVLSGQLAPSDQLSEEAPSLGKGLRLVECCSQRFVQY